MRRRLSGVLLLVTLGFCPVPGRAQDEGAVQTAPVAITEAQLNQRFAGEPTLQEVYRMAEREIGLHPDRIDKWMSRSSMKYLLPILRARYRTTDDVSTTLSIREDPDRTIIGPDDEATEDQIEFTATWNLPELLFARQDKRDLMSMTQRVLAMRTTLLRQVAEIYYERRRHQVELAVAPPASPLVRAEKALRIAELGAELDVLTGGGFTNRAGGNP